MNSRDTLTLQEAWQQATREHAAFLRDARAAKLNAQEIHKRGRIYVLRIDAAFARLKSAERYSQQLG